jgi:hypothetical protein
MKKLFLSVMVACVLLFIVPIQLKADTDSTPVAVVTVAPTPVAAVDASVLIARVETIKEMDISTLNSSEKKELRKELRSIKGTLKELSKSEANAPANTPANAPAVTNGGVYLSVGAIIIIILLLILLL